MFSFAFTDNTERKSIENPSFVFSKKEMSEFLAVASTGDRHIIELWFYRDSVTHYACEFPCYGYIVTLRQTCTERRGDPLSVALTVTLITGVDS